MRTRVRSGQRGEIEIDRSIDCLRTWIDGTSRSDEIDRDNRHHKHGDELHRGTDSVNTSHHRSAPKRLLGSMSGSIKRAREVWMAKRGEETKIDDSSDFALLLLLLVFGVVVRSCVHSLLSCSLARATTTTLLLLLLVLLVPVWLLLESSSYRNY